MNVNHSKKTVEFEFLDQKIVLKSGEDPELVQEAVRIAEIQIREAHRRSKTAAPYQVALLALLDLAEEYVRAKRRSQKHRRMIEKKSSELLSLVEKNAGHRRAPQ